LFQKLAEAQEGNVVVSPIGVKIVLAMLYEGSLGKTAAEIKTVLELPETRGAVRKRFGTILASLQVRKAIKPIERYQTWIC
jgi:serine protease inhibitor